MNHWLEKMTASTAVVLLFLLLFWLLFLLLLFSNCFFYCYCLLIKFSLVHDYFFTFYKLQLLDLRFNMNEEPTLLTIGLVNSTGECSGGLNSGLCDKAFNRTRRV